MCAEVSNLISGRCTRFLSVADPSHHEGIVLWYCGASDSCTLPLSASNSPRYPNPFFVFVLLCGERCALSLARVYIGIGLYQDRVRIDSLPSCSFIHMYILSACGMCTCVSLSLLYVLLLCDQGQLPGFESWGNAGTLVQRG